MSTSRVCEQHAGKNNEGVKKMTVCEETAKKIRTGKNSDDDSIEQVISKFDHLDPNL